MSDLLRADADRLAMFCTRILRGAGADEPSAEAAGRAMMHGSRYGIDSHGVRLLGHYVRAFQGGRLNGAPSMTFSSPKPATGLLEADDAHGAVATFTAMNHACTRASEMGIGAIGIQNSSHFGPAGAYALHAARKGFIGLTTCNSDSFVRLHDGTTRFHGTNPIAVAVPTGQDDPWLLDMATSAVPFNRVRLYRSLGTALPEGVASDASGVDTKDPHEAVMLAPLGGEFGFKGAALGGVAEILSAVLTGMGLSPELAPMVSDDMSTPRGLGAFVLALDPDGFVGGDIVRSAMQRYLKLLRAVPARPGMRVMAPGDREWAEAERRSVEGIPLDQETRLSFEELSTELGVPLPW